MALKLPFLQQNRKNHMTAGGSVPPETRLSGNGLFNTGPKLDNFCAKTFTFGSSPLSLCKTVVALLAAFTPANKIFKQLYLGPQREIFPGGAKIDPGPPKLSEAITDKSKKVFTKIWSFNLPKITDGCRARKKTNLVQNLMRQPQLLRAPLNPGPGTMYPLNPPLVGPDYISRIRNELINAAGLICLFFQR